MCILKTCRIKKFVYVLPGSEVLQALVDSSEFSYLSTDDTNTSLGLLVFSMTQINQKEYLKRYMSADASEGKKKKIKTKKKKPVAGASVKIIDDDVDINFTVTEEGTISLLDANEDAPQIVGVVDERPLHLRQSDFKTDSWKPVELNNAKSDSKEPQSDKNASSFTIRTLSKNEDSNVKRNASPPRRKNHDSSPPRRKYVDSSPPRRRNSDSSPPRRKNFDSSPPRRKNQDCSPPRKSRFSDSPARNRSTARQQKQDSSPPRRRKSKSPSRRRQSRSPSRRTTSDLSPPRRIPSKSLDSSPPRRQTSVNSPEHKKRKLLPGDSKGRYMIPAKRMAKTLDGKTAAFQNAQDMAKEMETFKQRENEMFDALCKESTVYNKVRERKTGRNANSARKAEERAKREKEEAKYQEIYTRWGHGLKQIQDKEEKLAQDLHEMTKPLARYADDEDLENYLKQQVREGDPMLEFMKKKNPMKPGTVLKQSSTFSFLPNRFGIPPGHQWDGVDRSNGYEVKFIESKNAKLMQQEETYRWSTEDM